MPAASVSLKLVTDVSSQPADVVAWSADGIVTADLTRVVRWTGDQPGTPIAYSAPSYGVPRSITLLPDGVVGVGALRIARDGALIVDNAKLGAALVTGDPMMTPGLYRTGSAAWTADGAHLWLGVEQKKAGSRDKPIQQVGPKFRNLVVDAQLGSPVDLSATDARAWIAILAAGSAVVTRSDKLTAWPAGPTGARHDLATTPPLAAALDPSGTSIAFATSEGVQVAQIADGAAVASFQPAGLVGAIAIATDARWIATGSTASAGDGLLQLWHLDGDQATLAAELALPDVPLSMAFSPDGARLVIGAMAQRVLVVDVGR